MDHRPIRDGFRRDGAAHAKHWSDSCHAAHEKHHALQLRHNAAVLRTASMAGTFSGDTNCTSMGENWSELFLQPLACSRYVDERNKSCHQRRRATASKDVSKEQMIDHRIAVITGRDVPRFETTYFKARFPFITQSPNEIDPILLISGALS